MYEQLKQLETRLSRAAGDAWLEATEYYFEGCDRDLNDPHLRELDERSEILSKAIDDVKTALKVIEAVA